MRSVDARGLTREFDESLLLFIALIAVGATLLLQPPIPRLGSHRRPLATSSPAARGARTAGRDTGDVSPSAAPVPHARGPPHRRVVMFPA